MPLFLRRNSTPTIPHCFRNLQRSKFPYCCADVAKELGRKESNVYEVNQWLWPFGRGKPRLPRETVSETVWQMDVMQEGVRAIMIGEMAVMQERARRGHANRTKRRRNSNSSCPLLCSAWRQNTSLVRQ